MSFKKNKYTVIKQAISKDLATFCMNYLLMKRQVYDTCIRERYISPYETLLGGYENKNGQVPNTYASYGDIAMETLLLKCQPAMEKETRLKLYPACAYTRIYKKNDVLKKHTDRFSCEISTTLNLGGDEWPIYLKTDSKKIVKILLKPGDMLIYRGCDLEHWREKFKGKECVQVFLHYNNCKTSGAKHNMFDKRFHLGLPSWFKKLRQ